MSLAACPSPHVRADPGNTDQVDLESDILRLLDERAPGATICPSDVARDVGTSDGWRELMEPVRQAARRLVDSGAVEITQQGRVVDLDEARGPIRIRRGKQGRQDA